MRVLREMSSRANVILQYKVRTASDSGCCYIFVKNYIIASGKITVVNRFSLLLEGVVE